MFMKWHLGRGNFSIKMEGQWFFPSLPQNPVVIKNGEIYAKVKNINMVSGYSDQHGHLAGV
jgi:hypothetical protein